MPGDVVAHQGLADEEGADLSIRNLFSRLSQSII